MPDKHVYRRCNKKINEKLLRFEQSKAAKSTTNLQRKFLTFVDDFSDTSWPCSFQDKSSFTAKILRNLCRFPEAHSKTWCSDDDMIYIVVTSYSSRECNRNMETSTAKLPATSVTFNDHHGWILHLKVSKTETWNSPNPSPKSNPWNLRLLADSWITLLCAYAGKVSPWIPKRKMPGETTVIYTICKNDKLRVACKGRLDDNSFFSFSLSFLAFNASNSNHLMDKTFRWTVASSSRMEI